MLARREIPLIEDDVYGDLHFEGTRPRPAKAFDRDGLVLLCSSFSKAIAPGYRVGWVAAGRFRDKVERLKFAHTVASATLPQMAIAEFLDTGGYDHHLRGLRRKLAEQVRAGHGGHHGSTSPLGTRVSRPSGGSSSSGSSCRRGTNARPVQTRARPEHLQSRLDRSSAKSRLSNFIRMSCGYPFDDVLARAIATLGRLASALGGTSQVA